MTAEGSKAQDLSRSDVLSIVFSKDALLKTIRRMTAWQEVDNEVTHPLKRQLLLEYDESLAVSLAASVPSGNWRPSSSYLLLVSKRSGTYRELAFPSLVDTIVGRRIIDDLEPPITRDDNNRVFFGRSHANTNRERGDYESWFKVWMDYTAKIGDALEQSGFAYVFDTDVTQFFPSVDRERAKHAIAQRTQAHQSLLELLFYCVETWAPRVRYCAVPGLPIEPNDISRIIAHNYLKSVDEYFVDDSEVHYLRWVDDTVVFVKDETSALEVKRRHHLALREIGLSPNASKTSILKASDYAATRHPEFNRRIGDVRVDDKASAEPALAALVHEWYAQARQGIPNWDKVAARLYSMARKVRSSVLRNQAFEDIASRPAVMTQALKYLRGFPIDASEAERLFSVAIAATSTTEQEIEIARLLCDAIIQGDLGLLVPRIVGRILARDRRPGGGYAKSLFLLFVHKHGGKDAREAVRKGLTLDRLQDDQVRLHYIYVFMCRHEIDEGLLRAAKHLETPDIALMTRICQDAREGTLTKYDRVMKACFRSKQGVCTVEAASLPLLFALLRAKGREAEIRKWVETIQATKLPKVADPVIYRFLQEEITLAKR